MKHFTEPTDEIYEFVVGPDRLVAVVLGNPAVKKRAGRTPNGRVYNPSQRLEKEFAKVIMEQLKGVGHPNFTFGNMSSLEVYVTLNFAVCGRTTAERQRSLWAKGDPDNFCKFIQDSLQGYLFANDKQIVKLHCHKIGWVGIPQSYTRVEIVRQKDNETVKLWNASTG